MKGTIQCFLLEPTNRAEKTLRRFLSSEAPGWQCSEPSGYHQAIAVCGELEWTASDDGVVRSPTEEEKLDPLWPVSCGCGYQFKPEDPWQHRLTRLYKQQGGSLVTTTDKAPSGAMWYADWMEEYYRGMDGHSLVVRTPAGDWYIDGPSSSGGKWARQGDVPVVTVSPSIVISELRNPYGVVLMPGYHGWLREGRLLEL